MSKLNLTEYRPNFERSAAQNEDVETYLDRLVTEPCGSDGLTFSEKSNNSSAKSLSHAGKMIPTSLVRTKNEIEKKAAFALRFPTDADLVGFDDEVTKRYKAFGEYDKTSELTEVAHLLNSEKTIPVDVRDKVAKHVAAIGGYSGYLTDDISETMAVFALNYWVSKNPVLKLRIEQLVDRN